MKDFLLKTIQSAGDLALKGFRDRQKLVIEYKSAKDLVSEVDLAVEKFLKQELLQHFPDFGFFGEEQGVIEGKAGRWIVDPIDGTLSFCRGQHYWSISIGVEIQGVLTLGAVYAPALDTLYFAEKGKGALKNGMPIAVSLEQTLQNSVLATGFACVRAGLKDNNLNRFSQLATEVMGLRIRGSAALDLCAVADGQLEGFWEQHLNLYDIAGGALILTEAGGLITDFKGNPGITPSEVVATNSKIHKALLEFMK